LQKIQKMKNTAHREKMFGLINKWQKSGQTQIEFAKQHEIGIHTLKYWIYKFRKQNKKPEGFICLEQITTPEICLRYPNGIELLIPAQTPVSFLRELIKIQG